MSQIPFYLQQKLSIFTINSIADLKQHNYLQVFAWLKDKFPSVSFRALYNLYCIVNNRALDDLTKLEQQVIMDKYKMLMPCYIPLSPEIINQHLGHAINAAKTALTNNEIPIGAVIFKDNQIIATGYNQTLNAKSNIMHAEIVAIREAQAKLGTMYLDECDLYVTIEPCLMCSGAIIGSRIKRVVFGALEPKTGACVSQYKVFNNKAVNHKTEMIGPIDNKKYAVQLQQFLKNKR
jgi:tRNA(adenine34) deaminase